jgi:hypothetical protein
MKERYHLPENHEARRMFASLVGDRVVCLLVRVFVTIVSACVSASEGFTRPFCFFKIITWRTKLYLAHSVFLNSIRNHASAYFSSLSSPVTLSFTRRFLFSLHISYVQAIIIIVGSFLKLSHFISESGNSNNV